MHNLHTCSAELRSSIDAHAVRLDGWGVPQLAIERAVEAAVIVAALTEDALLAAAPMAQAGFAHAPTEARDIELHFGPGVSKLARELTHFGDIRLTPVAAAAHHLEPAQAEALRKMLLSVVSDPRLVLARLARQLVELNASKDGHATTRERLALETREVFAPLANRLGLWQLKWELEDLAFRFLQPDDYRRIAAALAEKRADRERYITELCRTLETMMRAAGIDGEVYGRPKHIYSIHRKMERKQLSFEQVFDLRAVRIVTARIEDCYAVLGLVHGRYPYIPGEFDDYIATPKDNLYRSIHTAVFGPEGKAVEVQIRTREMHDQAELGLAAHWRYKESRALDVSYDRKIEWVRKLLVHCASDGMATDDRGFPRRSPRRAVRRPRLRAHAQRRSGGSATGSHAARLRVPRAYRPGTPLPRRARERAHRAADPRAREWRDRRNHHPQIPAAESRLVIGDLRLPGLAAQPLQGARLVPEVRRGRRSAARGRARTCAGARPGTARRLRSSRKPSRSPVVLGDVEDLPTSFARCCAPMKPEPIAGYATVGRGVTIHRADCPGLTRMSASHPDRLIAAAWADVATSQPVTLTIVAIDRQGLVRDVGDLLASEKISIEMMHTTTDQTQSTATIDVRLGVADAQHLTRLLQRIRKVTSVLTVRRSG